MEPTHTPAAIRLFLSKQLVATPDGCLLYPGKPTARGYGQLETGARTNRRGHLAHRIAYEVAYGSIPDGMQVDHTCHVRLCVNPSHLRLATHSENQQNRTGADSTSTTGFRGVRRHRDKFQVRVQVDGVVHYGGDFSTVEAAAQAASALRRKYMPFSEMDKQESP